MKYLKTAAKRGNGFISGCLALALGIANLFGVLCFYFPTYLTTPELRNFYTEEGIRLTLFCSMILTGALILYNFIKGKSLKLSGMAIILLTITIFLGGYNVEIGEIEETKFYMGLDWFVLGFLSMALLFIFLEKLFPLKKEQSFFRKEWDLDLQYFFINHIVVGILLLFINFITQDAFGWAKMNDLGSFIALSYFPIQVFLAIFSADLIQWGSHFLYHKIPFLWRFHSIHHSTEKMDWLAGSRQHIIELFITRTLIFTGIFLLGFSKEVIDIYLIVVGLQAVLVHANLNLKWGFLEYLIVTPKFHHWHHAKEKEAIDVNFAVHFPVIDMIFGTYLKKKRWPQKYGVFNDEVPRNVFSQTLYPFAPNFFKKKKK